MPREIIIDIDQNGNATIEGKGFSGGECTKLTAAIEEALGDVTKRDFKPEYRQVARVPIAKA